MLKRMIAPMLFGLFGVAILLKLGFWQLERLTWKQDVLARIEARIGGAPMALPQVAEAERHKFQPVALTGVTGGIDGGPDEIFVLVSRKDFGAGYRVITPFLTQGRRVLLDRGFILLAQKSEERPPVELTLTGNLHWPDDRNSATPPNDLSAGIWFARDIAEMAALLRTEPVLVVARSDTGQGVRAMPLGPTGIPNNHLNYAITWFLFAAVWFGMTGYLLWRIRRKLD